MRSVASETAVNNLLLQGSFCSSPTGRLVAQLRGRNAVQLQFIKGLSKDKSLTSMTGNDLHILT